MKRARSSEEQIIEILKAAEVAGNARAVCREHNITEQTFYRWRRKYSLALAVTAVMKSVFASV